ncbi:MAG: hypothetical protein ACXW0J_07520 [Nitrososphaeraceae archaeon]
MKIDDVLSEELTKEIPTLKQSKKELGKAHYPLNPRKWQKLGVEGQQAAAYMPGNKDVVVKKINIAGPNDPVYQFLRVCKQHQDNPFLPKFYSIKMYPLPEVRAGQRQRYKYKLIVTMEKLYHIGKAMYPLLEKLFGVKFDDIASAESTSKQLKYRYFGTESWRKELINNTSNSELKQALRLIEPLFKHYHSDMHIGNIMIRRTGSLPQFVISDPVI